MKRTKRGPLSLLLMMLIMVMCMGLQAHAAKITTKQVKGTWDGTYVGNWRNDSGQLVDVKRHVTFVFKECTTAGKVSGVVYVAAIPGRDFQYTGSYKFSGKVNLKTGAVQLDPGAWVKQIPDGFDKSHFKGTFTSTSKLSGHRYRDTIASKYTFSVTKQSASTTADTVYYVSLNRTKLTLKTGASFKLKYSLSPSGLTGATAKWSSSKPSVAKVNQNGKVTALKAGATTITCKVTRNGKTKSATCKVTVKNASTKKVKLTGVVRDAATGKILSGATIKIRSGKNNKSGSAVYSGKSSSTGAYSCTLPAGTYTIGAGKNGYVASYTNITINGNKNVDLAITKTLAKTQYRVVLSWGSTPRDLDAHLTGPNPGYDRFHVYFSRKNAYNSSGKLIANLDVDDTSSYGPETVTINFAVAANGTYNYYVHDFTNRRTNSWQLANSGARVIVYRGSRQIASYYVPKKKGNKWKVFSIVNGKLKKVNTLVYAPYDQIKFQ